jgi:N-terminal TM domain of oligopeptide transport permease C
MSAITVPVTASRRFRPWRFVKRNPTLTAGAIILVLMALIGLFAPLIAGDPLLMQPSPAL